MSSLEIGIETSSSVHIIEGFIFLISVISKAYSLKT